MPNHLPILAALLAVATLAPCAGGQTFSHTEARHPHSLALTPDGTRLLAVHSAEARLSIFAVGDGAHVEPVLLVEIPVGLEPVAVRVRTNDEVWVVNELSDSVSIVSLSAGAVFAQGGQTRIGFGLNHDGTGHALPTVHPYLRDELGSESPNDFADTTAFARFDRLCRTW